MSSELTPHCVEVTVADVNCLLTRVDRIDCDSSCIVSCSGVFYVIEIVIFSFDRLFFVPIPTVCGTMFYTCIV